jgi:hypothetical protein
MFQKQSLSVLAIAAIGGLLGGTVANSFLSGNLALASKQKTLTAQQFEVVDGAGKVRGTLAVSGESGAVALTLLSNSGEPRVVIAAGADGLTSIGLIHKGKLRAEMKIAAGGTPDMEMWDDKGNPVFLQPKNTGVVTSF